MSYFKQNHNLGDKNVLRGHQVKPWYFRDEGTEVHRVNDSLPISRLQFVGSWDYSFFYFYLTTHYSVKLLLSQQQLRNNCLLIQVLVRQELWVIPDDDLSGKKTVSFKRNRNTFSWTLGPLRGSKKHSWVNGIFISPLGHMKTNQCIKCWCSSYITRWILKQIQQIIFVL